MQTLLEKAKTLPEWNKEFIKRGEINCQCCSIVGTKEACSDCTEILSKHIPLVRLEDAEQALEELKQKLQKLFKDIPFDAQLIGNKWEFYRLGTKKEWLLWIQKFEELLE